MWANQEQLMISNVLVNLKQMSNDSEIFIAHIFTVFLSSTNT